jgi:hypothetical protein
MKSSTAGQGDPYWYEWTVGLLRVVEMLPPDSGLESVTFQATGIKGWDDVVVRYTDGHKEFLQVKHSRVGKNITFGDLVAQDDQGVSLLSSLFGTWKELDFKLGTDKCILFTNRAAGERAGGSESGVSRPPLIEFIAWLRTVSERATAIADYRPPPAWEPAWKEWLAQLAAETPAEQLAFLKALELQTNQEDLPALENTLLRAICETFQITEGRALPLLHALDSALRCWTTNPRPITAEDAYSEMALDSESDLEHHAPPPPTRWLRNDASHPKQQSIRPPGMTLGTLHSTAELLNRLYTAA